MILEYLSQNALIKYPFRDDAALSYNGGTGYWGNNYILDIVFSCKTNGVANVYLQQYRQDTFPQTSTFTFVATDQNGATLYTSTMTQPWSAITNQSTITSSDSNCSIKLVCGQGLVDYQLLSSFIWNFDANASIIVDRCIKLLPPRITSISLYNSSTDSLTPAITPILTITPTSNTALEIDAGANMNYVLDGTISAMTVFAGDGTGLYDNCPTSANEVILSIDNIPPDAYGNFLITTDDCYTVSKIDNGLSISNICTPRCPSELIDSYAHYLNRIIDGTNTVTNYAISLKDSLKSTISDYNTNVVPNKNSPFYKIKYSSSLSGSTTYYNFAVGIFNPSDTATAFSITSSTNFINGSLSLQIGDTFQTISNFPVNGTCPCFSSAMISFTAKVDPGTVVGISGTLGSGNIDYSVTV